MAKTINTNLPSVSTGDVLSATAYNNAITSLNSTTVPPMAKITKSATTRPYTSGTAIAFDNGTTNGFDTDGMYSAGSNTLLTAKTAGVYLVTANLYCAWEAGTATNLTLQVRKNATGIGGLQYSGLSIAAIGYWQFSFSEVFNLALNDAFDMNLSFTGASTMNVYGDSTALAVTSLSLVFLGKSS